MKQDDRSHELKAEKWKYLPHREGRFELHNLFQCLDQQIKLHEQRSIYLKVHKYSIYPNYMTHTSSFFYQRTNCILSRPWNFLQT